MKDALYDFDKGAEGFMKFARDYEPDAMFGQSYVHMGEGPMFELMKMKNLVWAGAPGARISDNSIHQFIEYPVLLEEDMEFFGKDFSGWLVEKGFPAVSGLLEPFNELRLSRMSPSMEVSMLASAFSTPKMRETIKNLWDIADMKRDIGQKQAELDAKLEAEGFPVLHKGFAAVPFDAYSDFYRGTLDTMMDMYVNPDVISDFRETQLEYTFEMIRAQGQALKGKWVFMALHKGMDTFLSGEQYRDLYWSDLSKIIEEIISQGMTPYIYTEGKYDSRLEFLKEVTKGKVVYHFEECDMLSAKKALGDTACISGGFPVYLLDYGTKQQVIDECKRLIDGCAAGGGYIFETCYGFDNSKPENVEAMFDTVKTYGKR
jgi:uroporphyrinogen-III decarboxylase